MKTRLILSLLASVLVVFAALFIFSVSLVPMPMQLVNVQPVQARSVVMSSPPVAVSPALKQEVPEVAPAPEAKNEVFKCKVNGQIIYSATPCAAGAVVVDYNARRASFMSVHSMI